MNEFRISGRVNKIDIKYNEDGSCYTKVFLSQKVPKQEKYNPFNIIFFNKNGVAEKISEKIKQGDYIEAKCYVTPYEFVDKDTGKTRTTMNIIGITFDKLLFDKETNKFIKAA